MTFRARLAASVLPLVLAATALAAAPSAVAAEAGASACTHPSWSNQDAGTGELRGSETEAAVRSGPYSACPAVGYLHYELAYYHCFVANSYGNTWTHIRFVNSVGKSVNGWIWDEHLNDGGSNYYC
ncbi:SH3 domain-containing protein [Streptomyces sp. RFCAC02]|uniref:SH3 domain-containing protein n=1 Tax=Streptomyces sp. RFCAC02 TaxID=2499143 RepID=UPI001020D05B|nr:SH3 domain-containing protein [Streptomyces sp. RFCAC02]